MAPDVWAGDVARGRTIALDRQKGLCVLCHAMPDAAEGNQGDLGPSLAGIGARLDANTLKARLLGTQPGSIMPAYGPRSGLTRVAPAWRGQPILTADEIEDVVAYLASLT